MAATKAEAQEDLRTDENLWTAAQDWIFFGACAAVSAVQGVATPAGIALASAGMPAAVAFGVAGGLAIGIGIVANFHKDHQTPPEQPVDIEREGSLGNGQFGSVELCRRKATGERYALKKVGQLRREKDVLAMMDSDFIIRVFGSYQDHAFAYILLEFCPGGTLYGLGLKSPAVFMAGPGTAAKFFCGCVVMGLEHMHHQRVAHRDLKLDNVFLDANGYAKLGDLGFATVISGKSQTCLGTPQYMAPEIIDAPHCHNHMVDWWALGVLVHEMLTGKDPWRSRNDMKSVRAGHEDGVKALGRGWPEIFNPSRDFVKKLLVANPALRLGSNVDEVKRDAWFDGFDWNQLKARALPSPALRAQRLSSMGVE